MIEAAGLTLPAGGADSTDSTTSGPPLNTADGSYLFVLPWSLEHAGGVNQVVINLGHAIRDVGGLQPIVLICDWNAPKPIWGESHGLKTVNWRVRPYHSNMRLKERIGYWLWERNFRTRFRGFCAENRVAVVNPHYPCESAFALERTVRDMPSPPRFVLSFHGTDVNSHRSSSATTISQWKALLLRSNGVVACSHDLAKTIQAVFGMEIEPEAIHNGVDANVLTIGAPPRTARDGRVILCIGKYDEVKGQDVLISAYASISADYPDLRLVFVGASGPALPCLKSLCTELGVERSVSFHRDVPHERIGDFLAQASLFVLPSRREALGIAILEAGCFGLPVIASRVGGIPEIIENGRTGRLTTPDMPSELAECIKSMLDDPSNADALGARLKESVESNFTWTACARKYLRLIADSRQRGGAEPLARRQSNAPAAYLPPSPLIDRDRLA